MRALRVPAGAPAHDTYNTRDRAGGGAENRATEGERAREREGRQGEERGKHEGSEPSLPRPRFKLGEKPFRMRHVSSHMPCACSHHVTSPCVLTRPMRTFTCPRPLARTQARALAGWHARKTTADCCTTTWHPQAATHVRESKRDLGKGASTSQDSHKVCQVLAHRLAC